MKLIDLPNELLVLIVRLCRDPVNLEHRFINHEYGGNIGAYLKRQDINSISQSCKKLNFIATSVLYQTLCVTGDRYISHLERTLRIKPELAQYPRTVIIDYKNFAECKMKIRFLANLPHIEHLYIRNIGTKKDQSTDCVDIWEGAMKPSLPGALSSLSSLRSCSLFLRDTDWSLWSTREAWEIFMHPTLERITLCYTTTYQSSIEKRVRAMGKSNLHSTRLQELHFVDSDVTPDSLKSILQCPKSLKALTIYTSEGWPPVDYHEVFLPEQYLDCMRETAPTLQYFRFHDNSRSTKGAAIGLASFTSLRILDIDIGLLFERIKPVAEIPFEKIIPPNLEILRINSIIRDCYQPTNEDHCHEYLLELAKNLSTWAPNLRKLIFRDRSDWHWHRIPSYWIECDKTFRDYGVEVVDEDCEEYEAYCRNHNGDTLLSYWRKSRRNR